MTKKRKVSSPPQEGQSGVQSQSELYADLKGFITRENAKCVKQIQESNDKRLVALEESLAFALDSVTAVSSRQNSANVAIQVLQKETEALRQRLRQLELHEDRQHQERRLTGLIFSGPALQALSRQGEATKMIRSVVEQYLRHALDSSQVRSVFRFRNGKILIEFTSAARDSDRDVLFRNKTKLKGSGLFVSESLTPRRHAMFLELLRLKREGKIFSVFTRSGDIFACRTRDSAPVRLPDPEAVREMTGAGTGQRPARGRAEAESRGEPSSSAPETDGRGRSPGSTGDGPAGMEVEVRSPTDSSRLSSAVPCTPAAGSRRGDMRAAPEAAGETPTAGRRRLSSALLDGAEEVGLVELSPPSDATSAECVDVGRSADGGGLGGVSVSGSGSSGSRGDRHGQRGASRRSVGPEDGRLESPIIGAEGGSSASPRAPASEKARGARLGSAGSPALTSGGRTDVPDGTRFSEGGAGGGVVPRPELIRAGSAPNIRGESVVRGSGVDVHSGSIRLGLAGAQKGKVSSRSGDIRNYF